MFYLYLPRYLEISLLQWRHSIRLHALPILYKLPILPSFPFIRAEKEISKMLYKPRNQAHFVSLTKHCKFALTKIQINLRKKKKQIVVKESLIYFTSQVDRILIPSYSESGSSTFSLFRNASSLKN